ncbi:hypothetical protein ACET3Z_013472 [Daucus carota]
MPEESLLERDSKVLAMACNGRGGDANFDTIVSDCKQELKHFDNVLVEFVYKSANGVAHFMYDLGEWLVTPRVYMLCTGV